MPRLTAIVITLNEAAQIDACLDSVQWADEILVVDSGSTDDTVARARAKGARVVTRAWPGYSAQKNAASADATHDWILSIDADERVSPALAGEIRAALTGDPPHAGYRIPRVAFHMGRWIRTTDWYGDFQLRLYDRRRARWNGRLVHESVTAEGNVGTLHNELQHYAYRDVTDHVNTISRYTTLAARQMYAEGRRTGFFELLIHPPAAFLRNYVLKRGFADGATGFVISSLNTQYVFLKFAKLWALQLGWLDDRPDVAHTREGTPGPGDPGATPAMPSITP